MFQQANIVIEIIIREEMPHSKEKKIERYDYKGIFPTCVMIGFIAFLFNWNYNDDIINIKSFLMGFGISFLIFSFLILISKKKKQRQ